MQNIIAIIWDFDKTLVDGYMQDPIFEEYKVNASEFWKEVNTLPGFTSISMYPQMLIHDGISYDKIIETLIENV